jgi:hypothetical protein
MNPEKEAMEQVLLRYLGSTKLIGLSGAEVGELEKRFGILEYGFQARTRATLQDWSKNLIHEIGLDPWLQLGSHFVRENQGHIAQLGLLPISFFEWLKKQSFESAVAKAISIDEAFFVSQHAYFDSQNLVQKPEEVLNFKIHLQESTQILENQLLVISRNRIEFFQHSLNDLQIQILKKLKNGSHHLEDLLPNSISEIEAADFLGVSVSKCWFRIER